MARELRLIDSRDDFNLLPEGLSDLTAAHPDPEKRRERLGIDVLHEVGLVAKDPLELT